MPKKKTQVACGWENCSVSVHESELAKHVLTHILKSDDPLADTNTNTTDCGDHGLQLTCSWTSCTFNTGDLRHFRRHVYFHALLARLLLVSDNLMSGMKQALPKCTRSPTEAAFSPPELPLPFRCEWEDCTMEIDDPQLFYDHVRYHIVCDYSGMSRIQTEFKCLWRDCGVFIAKRSALMLHMQKHTGQRYCICPHCGALLMNRAKFLDHRMRQASDSVKKYKCEYCPKRFASASLRQDHVRSHINTHRCSICGITCTGRVSLQRHIIYRHMNLRPFTCDICGNSFKSRPNLRRHERTIHSGEKVPCPHEGCSFIGANKTSTESHFRNNHGHWSGTWYACHLCEERVRTGSHLTKHLRKDHSLVLPQGHVRFNYKQSPDGLYRLVTLRYESLDVVNQVFTVPPSELQLHDSPPSPLSAAGGLHAAASPTTKTPPQQQRRRGSRRKCSKRRHQHVEQADELMSSGVSAMPVVLSLTCAERDPPDAIVTDDGRELTLPASVRSALTTGARVLVCVQNDQVQLLTRADEVMRGDSADEDNPASMD